MTRDRTTRILNIVALALAAYALLASLFALWRLHQ